MITNILHVKPVVVQRLDGWNAQIWQKPQKGSSPITFFENPANGETFFFKESHRKYPTEYWSEIVASKYGQYLGLQVLDYNVGLYENQAGCLSKHMLSRGTQELYHGVDVLNDHLKSFIVTDKPAYSYQDIVAVSQANPFFGDLLPGFVRMMVFDALIGNGDRHSENWALVVDYNLKIGTVLEQKQQAGRRGRVDLKKTLFSVLRGAPGVFFADGDSVDAAIMSRYSFSPIYDSGSCLGRELTEVRIAKMLQDAQMFQAYLNRGKSEVRWNGAVLRHVDIVRELLKAYPAVKAEFAAAFARCSKEELRVLVEATTGPAALPAETALSSARKDFLTELLFARTEFVKDLLENG